MQIRRKVNWQSLLQDYLIRQSTKRFEFGSHDCALFVSGAVEAMTGKDIAKQFGEYKSLAEGMRKLRAAGYENHVDFIAKNFEAILPPFAQPGDIAFVDGDIDNAGGIVQGQGIYVIMPTGIIGLVSLMRVKSVYRVPYPKEK